MNTDVMTAMNTTEVPSAMTQPISETLLGPHLAAAIKSLLGDKIAIEVVKSTDAEIPECLRSQHGAEAASELRRAGIVGIRCGSASDGLVAVGFLAMQAVERFMADNSSLSACPVTQWNELYLVWVRSDFTPKRNLDAGELIWLVGGIVPLAWLSEEQAVATVIKPGIPQFIAYDQIVWPEAAAGTMRFAFLSSLYGPFFLKTGRKKILNLSLWAPWLSEQLQVRYDAQFSSFRHCEKRGEPGRLLPAGVVTEAVTTALGQAAAHEPAKFPVTEIRPRRVAELIEMMKTMTALRPPMSEAEGLAEFLRTRLVEKAGANVTSEELWQAYQRFCQEAQCLRYTRHELLEVVPHRIKELYGRTRSHGLKRGGYRRGYYGLALVGGAPPAAAPEATTDRGDQEAEQAPGLQPTTP